MSERQAGGEMLVVLALGNNALLQPGDPFDPSGRRRNIRAAAKAVAEVARQHRVVVTHGNGPQVGLLGGASPQLTPYALDVLDAESEGMVGYLFEQELGRYLPRGRLATILTQVRVDADDRAFAQPSVPVGPLLDETDARRIARARGWAVAPYGDGWRRVVPSPEPLEIVELEAIRILVDHGIVVTCTGGGGIPVAHHDDGGLMGVEAVIDKDLAAGLLAVDLGADALILLTDVEAVCEGWGTDGARQIGATTTAELRSLELPKRSMGPKVEAICRFVDARGPLGAIGALADAAALVRGEVGTVVRARAD